MSRNDRQTDRFAEKKELGMIAQPSIIYLVN